MSSKRIGRISEEIKKLVSELIRNELKDPRISPMTSVTQVEVTRDLRYAKIFISVLGNEEEKSNTIKALEKGSGFIRREIGNNINIRYTPEPLFYIDKSIEQGFYITGILDKLKNEDEKRGKSDD